MSAALIPAPQSGFSLSVPLSAGSLDAYIAAVNRLPMLSETEELELARRLRDDGDVTAARQLVLSHLRMVVSIARGYLGYGLPYADLIQEGNVGLMKAVKRFDPERGVHLVSFAIHWIKAEIHEFVVRNWRLVKIATTKAQRKLFFNLRSLRETSDTLTPTQLAEVAEKLNVRPEDVAEMEARFAGGDVGLDGNPDDGDEGFAPIDYLADGRYEPTRVIAAKSREALQSEGLQQALETLDPRSRRIVEARWLPADDAAATLHDLAAEFGVSAERSRQIEAKALTRMRAALAEAA